MGASHIQLVLECVCHLRCSLFELLDLKKSSRRIVMHMLRGLGMVSGWKMQEENIAGNM